MRKAGRLLLTLVAGKLCLTTPCRAQASLGLADAVNSALRSRASLEALVERISAAEGIKRQAGAFPNPEFQFQNENLRPGQTYTRDVDTLALINQPLDVLGKRTQRVAVAEEGRKQAQSEYELARWQVAQRVKLAYWAARGAQEVRQVWINTLDNFQKILEYHAGRLSAGAIAEQDYLRVRLEGERLKVSSDLAVLDANRARIELLREMGRTDFTEVILTEPLEPPAEINPVGIEQVLARRADIGVARSVLQQAKANAKLQEVSARPDLNLTLGYKRTQLPDALDGVNTALASLRITLPVTDKNQGNRAAAEAEIRRYQQLLRAAEAEARADYVAALQEYEFRRQEFLNTLEPLRLHAGEITRIAAAAYAEGGTDLLRLLDAERVGLEAELARTRGLVEYRQSIARLESAEGVDQ
jgi:cobalt-zinc-cadmium efflux system outer membrane protein